MVVFQVRWARIGRGPQDTALPEGNRSGGSRQRGIASVPQRGGIAPLRHHPLGKGNMPLGPMRKTPGVWGQRPQVTVLSGVRFLRFLARLPGALARTVELQDDGVVHQAVDGGHRGHRVLEDLVPLAEDQV